MKQYKKTYLKHFNYGEQDFIPCENCGLRASSIHHLIFRSQGGTDKVNNLMALCELCHTKVHNSNKEFNDHLKRKHKQFLKQN